MIVIELTSSNIYYSGPGMGEGENQWNSSSQPTTSPNYDSRVSVNSPKYSDTCFFWKAEGLPTASVSLCIF